MKPALFVSAFVGLLLAAPPVDAAHVRGQLLVKGIDLGDAPKLEGHRYLEDRPLFGQWRVIRLVDAAGKPASHEATQIAAGRLAEHFGSQAVSLNHQYQLSLRPDDDDIDDQWAISALGLETAWDTSVGLGTQRIGVIDSGIRRDHRDLRDKDVAGYDFISDPAQALDNDGRDDNYADDFQREDCAGERTNGQYHGTAVSGAILAMSDNSNRIAGINWNAGLVSARVAGLCDVAVASDVLDAAAWMAGLPVTDVPPLAAADRPRVVNLSFGREGACSAAEADLFAEIAERGVLVVAPTGNSGGAVEAPANCADVVAVAAHDQGRTLAAYSSVSGTVDLVAPGGDLSMDQENGLLSLDGRNNNATAWREGTSLAAAYVSGTASLLWAARPELTLNQVKQALVASGASCTGCPAPALDAAAAMTFAVMLPEVAPPGADCSVLQCDDNFVCAGSSNESPVCRITCDLINGTGCETAEQHCLQVQGSFGMGACYDPGPITPGGPCNDTTECASGHLCRLDESSGVNVCIPQCHHGYSCPSGLECVDLNGHQKYCAEPVSMMPPTTTPTVTMPPPKEDEETCLVSNGTLGCPAGEGCLDDGDGDDVGFCYAWNGTMEGGSLCDDRYSCASGLCESGVCLMGCDSDCPAGFSCEARGEVSVCMPSSCSNQTCDEGWSCESTSSGAKACARSAGGCSARHRVAGSNTDAAWTLILVAGLWTFRRRRS